MRSAHNVLGVSSLTFCSMELFGLLAVEYSNLWYACPNQMSCLFPPSTSAMCVLHVQLLCFCIKPPDWPVCLSCLAEWRMSRPGATLKSAAVVVSLRALTALLQRWLCLAFCGLFRLLHFSHGEGTSAFEMKAPWHHPSIRTSQGPRHYFPVQQPLLE